MNCETKRRGAWLAPRLGVSALAIGAMLALSGPAFARNGNVAGAVAAGIIGGAAIGALAAGAAQAPPPPVVYPAEPVYAPGPVYVAPPPPGPPPGCWLQRERVWDGYGWAWRRVQVCR